MLGVGADDHNLAPAFDDLTFLTNGLNRSSDFHVKSSLNNTSTSLQKGTGLFISISDPAPFQVIRAQLHCNLIPRQNPNIVGTNLTGDMG